MKILVKDHYGIYRKGICALIKENVPGMYAIESNEATDLFTELASTGCDLLIINFRTKPDEASARLLLIRERFPNILVIVIDDHQQDTASSDHNNTITFLESNCSEEEVLTAITEICGRKLSSHQ